MKCIYCGYKFEGHETVEGETKHKDGDISFCINCGEFSEFKGNKVVKISIESLDEETQQELKDIRIAWLRTKPQMNVKKLSLNRNKEK